MTKLDDAIRDYRRREATERLRDTDSRWPGITNRHCHHCGDLFKPKFDTVKYCHACWRKRERALIEYDPLKDEILMLRKALADEVGRSQRGNVPDAPDINTLKFMLQQCHPDKNWNSDHAAAATRYLIGLRNKIKGD